MARRHGRAILPFGGKYKGVRLRLIPSDYLSWLTTTFVMKEPKWKWLADSLLAELRFRGLRDDLADTPDPEPAEEPQPKRRFRLEIDD